MTELKNKILNREVTVGILGLGYVGLPLFLECAAKYKKVIGFDHDNKKISFINAGRSYIKEISDKDIKTITSTYDAKVSDNLGNLWECDCIIVCVPTPLNNFGCPNIEYIKNAFISIYSSIAYRKKDNVGPVLVSLESTTYPGCTEDMNTLLKDRTLVCDEDYFLVFSPERIDPGNKNFNLSNTPKVVGGVTEKSTDIGQNFYEGLGIITHPVSNSKVAEMSKLLENTYRLINISLMNELKPICEKMGINIWEAIDAAKTKPFGFQAFYPSAGIGGHCIPIDPIYFNAKAKQHGVSSRLISEAIHINDECIDNNVSEIFKNLMRLEEDSDGSVLIVGLSYKPDTEDTRESPSLKMMKRLLEIGINPKNITYYDPYIKEVEINNIKFTSVLEEELMHSLFTVGVISVKHRVVDYDMIIQSCEHIVDLVNIERK